MIARPETAACADRPEEGDPDAAAPAAPPTQNTSAKAAIASADARRRRSGRSGKDRLDPQAVQRLRIAELQVVAPAQQEPASEHPPPAPCSSSTSSCVAKTSHGVPSGSCTQILSWRA